MGKILSISKNQNNDQNIKTINRLTVYDEIYNIKDNEAHEKIEVLEEKVSNIETSLEILNKTISKIIELNLNKV